MIVALLVAILAAILFPRLVRIVVIAVVLAVAYIGVSVLATAPRDEAATSQAIAAPAAPSDAPDPDAALGAGPLADYLRCLRAAHAAGEPLDLACAVFRGAYVQACETMGTLPDGQCISLADQAARRVDHP